MYISQSGVGKSSLINEVFGLSGTESGAAVIFYASERIHSLLIQPFLQMVSDLHAGEADIERGITPADNNRLILHDSRGFEAGEGGNLETVVKFIKSRNAAENPQDKLHAVWYGHSISNMFLMYLTYIDSNRLCLRIPVAGGSLAEAGIEKLLAMKESGEFGDGE